MNKTDTVNALCLAHRIVQYEVPPPKKYIRIIYKNKTLKIAAHLLLHVSHEVINCVNMRQRTVAEADQKIAPMGGWKTTPTPVIRLRTKNEYVTEYNPVTNVLNENSGYCYDEPGAFFDICKRGKEYRHVKNSNDRYIMCSTHNDPKEILIRIKTDSNLPDSGTFREDLAEKLGGKAVILMDFITFDKNMRLISRIPSIDGWNFQIGYFNYNVPRPVKRQRTS